MEIDQKLMNEARAFMGLPPLRPRARAAARSLDYLYDTLSKHPEADAEPPCEIAEVFLQQVGTHLRAAREEQGLSLGDIESETGISRGCLSRIETLIARNPTIDTLNRIADALGLRLMVRLVDLESETKPVK